MCVLVFIKIKKDTNPEKLLLDQKDALFSTIDKNSTANITKFMVYGTHFNLEGTLDIVKISGINIDYVDLVAKNIDNEEIRH